MICDIVKQGIARANLIPWSRFFSRYSYDNGGVANSNTVALWERSPKGGLLLHFITSATWIVVSTASVPYAADAATAPILFQVYANRTMTCEF